MTREAWRVLLAPVAALFIVGSLIWNASRFLAPQHRIRREPESSRARVARRTAIYAHRALREGSALGAGGCALVGFAHFLFGSAMLASIAASIAVFGIVISLLAWRSLRLASRAIFPSTQYMQGRRPRA